MALYDYPTTPNMDTPSEGPLAPLKANATIGQIATQGTAAERMINSLRVRETSGFNLGNNAESKINGLRMPSAAPVITNQNENKEV